MDLRNLETFIKVAETKSFSRSADALGLTQPAISKRIAALESLLDTPLFHRVGRTAQLTAAGQVLFPRAKVIEAEINAVKAELTSNSTDPTGTVTIGATPCVASNELAPILKQFIGAFPSVTVKLHLGTVEEVLELLDSNSLELAICPLFRTSTAKLSNNLRYHEIWRTNAAIAVSNNHPLATASEITIDDLRKSTAILPPAGSLASDAITKAIAAGADELIVSARTSNYSTMSKLAEIEMGWTCLPLNQMDSTLKPLKVHGLEFDHSILLIRRRDRSLSRAANAIIDALPVNGTKSQQSYQPILSSAKQPPTIVQTT